MKWLVLVLVAGVVLAGAWVRFAPIEAARWHRMSGASEEFDASNGAMRRIEAAAGGLARLDGLIRATPRTHVVAGSVAEGMITYVTRSVVFGFPDYTTVRQQGAWIEIFGRARYGLSDLGVNAARIEGWIGALTP